MRRAVLVLMVLSLVGLTSVVASTFNANSEDVTSFSTQVSLSVPSTTVPPATTLPPVIYVRAAGTLDLVTPTSNDSVTGQLVRRDTATVEAQANPERFVSWKSPAAPAGGYLLQGDVTLFIDQKGPGSNRMTAALLSCPSSQPDSSTGCTTIVVAVADVHPSGGSGFKERVVHFGEVDYLIPAGQELRLKIVNRAEQPVGTPVSAEDWDLQWGFLPARQSRLEIT